MVNNLKLKQGGIIAAILLLMVFLFTRDIKGLVKPTNENGKTPDAEQPLAAGPELKIEDVSSIAKNEISADMATQVGTLEAAFKNATGAEKVKSAEALAVKWDDLEKAAPSAMYLEFVAKAQPSLENWTKSGSRFLKAFDLSQDSLMQPALLKQANLSFKNALAIDSTNLEAKMGMGITIVNGMGMPMQGIAMLLDVVKQDPSNIRANMNLGLFSLKSGQFDKAVPRFTKVIEQKPSADAYFYLGTAYENLNRNQEAIAAYKQSKKIAGNPTLTQFLDKKVAELENKN
ncbi:tetratricopeptide repeat protein [Pedobacter sp. SYP-B3415]|uniref:tetratricopeptide repeat protein n=1 Tax=Pedobacter sp. SYP-B3415 TaxID=2496641 RepID=UPI00101C2743|nr:tetratricopeptide repeat protein [Pedobacter sp. SYP-B3415]